MKHPFLFICLGMMLIASSCTGNMKYDISEGFNKDITLFENEVSVPIGSVGPFTVMSTLLNSAIGRTFSEYVKEDPSDGSLVLESQSELYAINVHKLESLKGDVSSDFVWEPGSLGASVGGIASMLSWIKLQPLQQTIDITATNPLSVDVPVTAQCSLRCMSPSYEVSYSSKTPLDLSLTRRTYDDRVIMNIVIPEDVTDLVSYQSLDELKLSLPANPVSKLSDDTKGDVFSIKSKHRCKIGVADDFTFPQTFNIENLNLEIAKYQLSRCNATIEVENTLPLSVTINSIKLLQSVTETNEKGEEETDYVPDENIFISPGLEIEGGSIENPGVSKLTVEISAAEGTIPDITAIALDIEVKGQPGCAGVAFSGKQGIYIKSSSAKISGGITIPLN